MRKALIVGLDYYHDLTPLTGCVNDADAVAGVLGRHANGTTNFTTPKVLTSTGAHNAIERDVLRDCQSAFKFDPSSAFNCDPFERRGLAVALVSSELAGIAETRRARVA